MESLGSRTRHLTTLLVLVAVLAAGLAGLPRGTAAHASTLTPLSAFDARLLHHINHARAAHGLRPLTLAAGTTDVAHGWSCRLAADRDLAHNPTLGAALSTHGSDLWTAYAENVGMQAADSSARRLFKVYMASPEHRANILSSSARYLGLWSKRAGGFRYNTIDFVGTTTRSYDSDYGSTRRTC